MADMHQGAIEWTIRLENWSGRVSVISALDGRVTNRGVERYRQLEGRHLEPDLTRAIGPDIIALRARTRQSRIYIAEAARTRVYGEHEVVSVGRDLHQTDNYIQETLTFDVKENSPVRVEKMVALFSSRDHAINEPLANAIKAVDRCEPFAEAFEPFTFRHRGGGLFNIDPDWIDRNIEKTTVPVLGEVMCHRLIIPQLRAALEEIVELELDDLLDPDDYGGCWVPRHIGFDETRPLSMHAWGVAFDVNVHTNLYGDPPLLDERIVEVFDRHGFDWGGDWRTPDGMHFELREFTDTICGCRLRELPANAGMDRLTRATVARWLADREHNLTQTTCSRWSDHQKAVDYLELLTAEGYELAPVEAQLHHDLIAALNEHEDDDHDDENTDE
jgi:hypothetical protein